MITQSLLRRPATAVGIFLVIAFAVQSINATEASQRARRQAPATVKSSQSSSIRRAVGTRASHSDLRDTSRDNRIRKAPCGQCGSDAAPRRGARKSAKPAARLTCHPRGYVDPKIAKNLDAALRDMKRAGIKPKITSAWRSSGDQAYLHRCQYSRRCRVSHGVYGAMPAGKSMHEAGFAVDIAGVAAGRRHERRITPQGRRVVQIMKKNGFNWRYGLADPAHFEADPKKHGYRNAAQAIKVSQTRCQIKLAQTKKSQAKRPSATGPHARSAVNGKPHKGWPAQAAARKSSKPGSRA